MVCFFRALVAEGEVTAKRRLVPEREVASMAQTLRAMGFKLDGPIEVRADGVVFHPANQSRVEDVYERWTRENPDRD